MFYCFLLCLFTNGGQMTSHCTEGDRSMELWIMTCITSEFLKPVCLALPGPSSGRDGSSHLQSKRSLPSSSSLPAAAFPLATFLSLRLVKNFCKLELNLTETQIQNKRLGASTSLYTFRLWEFSSRVPTFSTLVWLKLKTSW